MTDDEMEAYQATKARVMKPEQAREVIDAFLQAEPVPVCNAAVTDDWFEVGFEWRFPDGRALIVDLDSDGDIAARWVRN